MQPPPPPPGAIQHGSPPPMPLHLQNMMRQMQKRQPKLQPSEHSPGLRPQSGERGRGRGRGGFHQQKYSRDFTNHPTQFKRKRGPRDSACDASRFFLPSFLKDPWKGLEASGTDDGEDEAALPTQNETVQWKLAMRPRQVQQCGIHDGPGRVLFQPSYLEDPWLHFEAVI